MENLTKLFNLIELTRSQPQYGYALAGIAKNDLSDLAQHHYLVSFIAWQLAINLRAVGCKVNVEKVLEYAMVHDLGELFGGDIAMPYARANPKARELAKAFESENLNYLSNFFGKTSTHFKKLNEEIFVPVSAEAIIAKLADYVELTHYKRYVGKLSSGDVAMARQLMQEKTAKIKDLKIKKNLNRFIARWAKDLVKDKNEEFFEKNK